MKKKIVVVGGKGKMGSEVAEVLKNDYFIICVGKDDLWSDFKADLVIDFGSAESSVMSANYCLKNKVPLIVGSTGQSQKEIKQIKKVATVAPLVLCANFSVGMVLVCECIKRVLKADIDDVCVFEKHHRNKKDIPSGTAKSLASLIDSEWSRSPQIIAERGGKEIGTHKIDFYFGEELISISHQAFSRKAFAFGVELAVRYIFEKGGAGLIDFCDVVKQKFGLKF